VFPNENAPLPKSGLGASTAAVVAPNNSFGTSDGDGANGTGWSKENGAGTGVVVFSGSPNNPVRSDVVLLKADSETEVFTFGGSPNPDGCSAPNGGAGAVEAGASPNGKVTFGAPPPKRMEETGGDGLDNVNIDVVAGGPPNNKG